MFKKMFLGLALAMFLIVPFSRAAVRNIQDDFQLVYHLVDVSGNHVTGQTVTLQIKKVSNGQWFDFSDSTFKSSGWTSKTTGLSENTTDGFYFYAFNPPASETAPEQYQFLIDNASGVYGDHQSEIVDYQDLASGTVLARVDQDTNGQKDGGDYNGIEQMIRQHGR